VRVIYYISPQVWAWRRGRVKTIARCVERMLVLFPFEVEFYRRHGVEVSHVGHPLIDEVPELEQRWQRNGGPPAGDPFVVALLPGSRASEVGALLPVMLRSAARLAQELPIVVRLIQAPTIPDELFDPAIEASGLEAAGVELQRVRKDRFHAVADSHLALCASGTATVEVGLLTTPLIVLYRLTLLSSLLGRVLVKLPFFSMVNLVLERPVVPELMQRHAEPKRVASEAARLLRDPEAVAAMRRALGELRERLGEGGASRRAAAEVARLLAEGER
jgi:lipid-A-disaccharide synthase